MSDREEKIAELQAALDRLMNGESDPVPSDEELDSIEFLRSIGIRRGRLYYCLLNERIASWDAILARGRRGMLRVSNFGRISLGELERHMDKAGVWWPEEGRVVTVKDGITVTPTMIGAGKKALLQTLEHGLSETVAAVFRAMVWQMGDDL